MTDWNTTAELDGDGALGTKARQIDRQLRAGLDASGALDPLPLFTLLAAVLEDEADVALRREAIALLVAYDATCAAQDQQDRYEIAKIIKRVHDDSALYAAHLVGRRPKPGLPSEHLPAQGQLANLEAAVAARRAALGLPPLPGCLY